MITVAALLVLLGIPTVAALTTGSALSMAVAWSQLAGLGINVVQTAGQLHPIRFPPLVRANGAHGRFGSVVAVVQGGPGGWGRAPVHFVYQEGYKNDKRR